MKYQLKAQVRWTVCLAVFLMAIVAFGSELKASDIIGSPGGEKKQTEKPDESEAPAPKKLVFAFQKQKDPRKIKTEADEVAAILTREIGIPVEVVIPANYGASVQALISNHAQVAYVDSLPFILARAEAPVEVLLVEKHDGRTDYDSLFVVLADSDMKSLADAKGKRMIFTSPTSTSGYLMAYSRLVSDGYLKKGEAPAKFFSQVSYAGGYDRALIGVLNGILIIGLIGYWIFRSSLYSSGGSRSRNSKQSNMPIVVFGLVVMIVGYVGVFFGKLIKSAVSRQREFLADASAVQFTRNPEGIVGALKKIGGLETGSRVFHAKVSEASHMFIADALSISVFETHPPIAERIRLLEPNFNGEFPEVKPLL